MSTDKKIDNLIINVLSKEQYDGVQNPSADELWLVPDEIDTVPVQGSTNPITSGAVYDAIAQVSTIQGTQGVQGKQGVQGPAGESSSANIVTDIPEISVLNTPTVSNISIVETLEPTLKVNIRKSLDFKSYVQVNSDIRLDIGSRPGAGFLCAMFDYGGNDEQARVKAIDIIENKDYTSLSSRSKTAYDDFYSAIGVTAPTVDGVKQVKGVDGAFILNPFDSGALQSANICVVGSSAGGFTMTFHLHEWEADNIASNPQKTINVYGDVYPTLWIHNWPGHRSGSLSYTKYIFKNLRTSTGIDIVVDLGEDISSSLSPSTHSMVIPWVENTANNNTNSNGTIYLLRGNLPANVCTQIANNRNGATIRCHIEDYDYYSTQFGTGFLKKFDYVIDNGAGIRAIGLAN